MAHIRHRLAAGLTAVAAVTPWTLGCQSEDLPRTGPSGKVVKNWEDDDDEDSGGKRRNSANAGVAGGGVAQGPAGGAYPGLATNPGGGTGTLQTASEAETGPVEYPKLTFNGKGHTTYEMKKHLAMTATVVTSLSDSQLSLDTTTANISCSGISGCKQNEVDEKTRANVIGVQSYDRATKAELESAKQSGLRVDKWAMFGKTVKPKNGLTFTFGSFLPIFTWPGAPEKYDALDGGSASWTAQVTASEAVPLSPHVSRETVSRNPDLYIRTGQAIREFTATVTATKTEESAGYVKLVIELNIPQDKDRMLYKWFGYPKRNEFRIDTNSQNLTELHSTNWSNGDKSKQAEETILTYKLCSKVSSKENKTFPCQ